MSLKLDNKPKGIIGIDRALSSIGGRPDALGMQAQNDGLKDRHTGVVVVAGLRPFLGLSSPPF